MKYITAVFLALLMFTAEAKGQRTAYGPFNNYKDLESRGWKFDHFEFLKDGSRAPIFIRALNNRQDEMACPFIESCDTNSFEMSKCVVLEFCQPAESWRNFPGMFKGAESKPGQTQETGINLEEVLSTWENKKELPGSKQKVEEKPVNTASYSPRNSYKTVEDLRNKIATSCPMQDIFSKFDQNTIVYVDDLLMYAYFVNGKNEIYSCDIKDSEGCIESVTKGTRLEECLDTSKCTENFTTKISCK